MRKDNVQNTLKEYFGDLHIVDPGKLMLDNTCGFDGVRKVNNLWVEQEKVKKLQNGKAASKHKVTEIGCSTRGLEKCCDRSNVQR